MNRDSARPYPGRSGFILHVLLVVVRMSTLNFDCRDDDLHSENASHGNSDFVGGVREFVQRCVTGWFVMSLMACIISILSVTLVAYPKITAEQWL